MAVDAQRIDRIRARLKSFDAEASDDALLLMAERSLGDCDICFQKNPDGRALALDHSHDTNLVRGFLCDRCNRALGGFRDDPVLLLSARDYLIERGVVNSILTEASEEAVSVSIVHTPGMRRRVPGGPKVYV